MIAEILKNWCADNDMGITDEQLADFERYAELLKEWNEKMNLTAITDDEGIAVKHFADSISILEYARIKNGANVIDIGTGAGFPGIPLKIMRPDIRLTLLDSLNKRLMFLREVCGSLGIEAELVHDRAEVRALDPEYREKFDTAVSRAVANLPALCEYCLPYVKTGGSFISMKGPDGINEIKTAENAVRLLGGKQPEIKKFELPGDSTRTIIIIEKISATPKKYPRRGQKINKSPIL